MLLSGASFRLKSCSNLIRQTYTGSFTRKIIPATYKDPIVAPHTLSCCLPRCSYLLWLSSLSQKTTSVVLTSPQAEDHRHNKFSSPLLISRSPLAQWRHFLNAPGQRILQILPFWYLQVLISSLGTFIILVGPGTTRVWWVIFWRVGGVGGRGVIRTDHGWSVAQSSLLIIKS